MIDLRRNTGGFPYATLAAAAPLLGDGIVGGSADVDDHVERWSLRDGAVLVGDTVFIPGASTGDTSVFNPLNEGAWSVLSATATTQK